MSRGEPLIRQWNLLKAMLSPRTLRYFSKLDETLLVKTSILNDYAAHDKTIRLLTRAIQDSLVVTLRYRSLSCSEPYDTGYRPYGLVFFNRDLYCIGLMDRYNEIRTLKLGRIVSAELTDTPFIRPQGTGAIGSFSTGKSILALFCTSSPSSMINLS